MCLPIFGENIFKIITLVPGQCKQSSGNRLNQINSAQHNRKKSNNKKLCINGIRMFGFGHEKRSTRHLLGIGLF
jgi:hypothetical protein